VNKVLTIYESSILTNRDIHRNIVHKNICVKNNLNKAFKQNGIFQLKMHPLQQQSANGLNKLKNMLNS